MKKLIFFIVALLVSAQVFGEGIIVTGGMVNVRSGPDFGGDSNIIGSVQSGTEITLEEPYNKYPDYVVVRFPNPDQNAGADAPEYVTGYMKKESKGQKLVEIDYNTFNTRSEMTGFGQMDKMQPDDKYRSRFFPPICDCTACGQSGTDDSNWGVREKHPVTGARNVMHHGCDMRTGGPGTSVPVRATSDGIVTGAQWKGGYGRWVEIKHSGQLVTQRDKIKSMNGYYSAYGHLKRILVKPGDRVKAGQIIGYSNASGGVTGAHLHFEIRDSLRNSMDPRQFMNLTTSTLQNDCPQGAMDQGDRATAQ